MKREISQGVYYVGVNDNEIQLFERLWPMPHGVSYNAYLIKDKSNVLIDTVEYSFNNQYMQQIEEVVGDEKIDYMVVNHMEPDHSSSLLKLKEKYPDIKIICNSKTVDMLSGFYGINDNLVVVDDGETLNIGEKTLAFYLTPMVHWPETMMTYIQGDGVLFSGDAFGAFGAINENVLDEAADMLIFKEEMYRYFSNIVGKYGRPVESAIKKLSGLQINMICATHGPVWKTHLNMVFDQYIRMARYQGEDGVVIAYGSMYGNTANVAKGIAEALTTKGVENVILHDLSEINSSYVLRDIFKYNTLILGSPTYSNDLFPYVADLVTKIEARGVKNRIFSCFGSYSWAGIAVKKMRAFAENMNWQMVEPAIEIKQAGVGMNIPQMCSDLAENIVSAMQNK